MSLIPLLFDLERPSRLLDQHFGLNLTPEDLLEPITLPHHGRHNYLLRDPLRNYYRPWRSALSNADEGSTIQVSKDKFQVNLDVQQFAPEDLNVTVEGKMIKVEGKHEEKQDQHGFISRHFVRKYAVPEDTDIEKVHPTLSTDGVLTIIAPRKGQDNSSSRAIPIARTGAPSKIAQGEDSAQKK